MRSKNKSWVVWRRSSDKVERDDRRDIQGGNLSHSSRFAAKSKYKPYNVCHSLLGSLKSRGSTETGNGWVLLWFFLFSSRFHFHLDILSHTLWSVLATRNDGGTTKPRKDLRNRHTGNTSKAYEGERKTIHCQYIKVIHCMFLKPTHIHKASQVELNWCWIQQHSSQKGVWKSTKRTRQALRKQNAKLQLVSKMRAVCVAITTAKAKR